MNDVQHPNHYTWRGTECTKAIEIMTSGATGADAMYIGNIVKYLYRYPAKGTPLKDLMKARQYLDFLITNEEVKEKFVPVTCWPPKFDITLKDSADFRKYINEIFLREAGKYELPMNTANSIKWFANGKIQVTFVDNDTTYVGVAKCHPDDAFNPEIGIKLAIERAAQAMHAPFVPGYDEAYFYVGNDDIKVGVNHHENRDVFNISLGNCFKTFEQADAHKDVIRKRIAKAAKLLEKLREDDKRCDG